ASIFASAGGYGVVTSNPTSGTTNTQEPLIMAYTVNPVSHVGHLAGAAVPATHTQTRSAAQTNVAMQHPQGVGGIGRPGAAMHTDQPGGSSKQLSVQSGLDITTHSPIYAGRGLTQKGG